MRANAVTCSLCGRPVPAELLPVFGDDAIAFCSGTCLRTAFQSAVLDLLKAALDPGQYQQLIATAEPSALPPPNPLPELTCTNHIREALQQITDLILSNRLTNKQASLLLYALQTALANIRTAAALTPAPAPHPNPPAGFTPPPKPKKARRPTTKGGPR
jgi:hypothetical protein